MFSEKMHDGNYDAAAKIALWTVLQVDGVDGIMNALHAANSYINRQKLRRGLN
jgi:hypothetical protein